MCDLKLTAWLSKLLLLVALWDPKIGRYSFPALLFGVWENTNYAHKKVQIIHGFSLDATWIFPENLVILVSLKPCEIILKNSTNNHVVPLTRDQFLSLWLPMHFHNSRKGNSHMEGWFHITVEQRGFTALFHNGICEKRKHMYQSRNFSLSCQTNKESY